MNPLRGVPRHSAITPRERQVWAAVASDQGNKQIAAALGISRKTVEKHRDSLRLKLGVQTPVGLTREAIRHGLIEIARLTP